MVAGSAVKESLQNYSQEAVQRLRRKGQERLTIMVIPHGQDRVFSLQLNWYLIIFLTGILFALVALTGYGIYESRAREREVNRLNQRYGSNFKTAIKLDEQTQNISVINEELARNLSRIAEKLGVDSDEFEILPEYSQADDLAEQDLNRENTKRDSYQRRLHYLPPVYSLKSAQYQIQYQIPLLSSVRESLHDGIGVYQKIPIGRPFVPTKKMVDTSTFGLRRDPVHRIQYEYHSGYDTRGPIGTPIRATADGKVYRINRNRYGGYGLSVMLQHDFGFYTLYAHLSRILVQPAENIRRGQLVGELGNTGRSTGPHLHYEIRYHKENGFIDPLPMICAVDFKTRRCIEYHRDEY